MTATGEALALELRGWKRVPAGGSAGKAGIRTQVDRGRARPEDAGAFGMRATVKTPRMRVLDRRLAGVTGLFV
jgi:hypothetical protein